MSVTSVTNVRSVTVPIELFKKLIDIANEHLEQSQREQYDKLMFPKTFSGTEEEVLDYINRNEEYVKNRVDDTVEFVASHTNTAIKRAIHRNFPKVVSRLIELGADISAYKNNVFYDNCTVDYTVEVFTVLVNAGCTVPDNWVFYVCEFSFAKLKQVLPVLVSAGKSINDTYGRFTLLYYYSTRLQDNIVHYLIDNGAEFTVNECNQIANNCMMNKYIDYYRVKRNIHPLIEITTPEEVTKLSYITVNGQKYNLVK
jgi:hypothetical protein